MGIHGVYVFFWLIFIFGSSQPTVDGRPLSLSLSRPCPDDATAFARWLICQSSWGVLSTIANDLGGAPFGNVVSFSDGLPDEGKGIPYFYLTTLDPTACYALQDQRSSFTISEYPIGTCGKTDPENPTCAKMTLTGKLKLIDGNSNEAEYARTALFSKHPEMKGWPKDHDFQVFALEIEDIFMINWFGGRKPLTVEQYLHGKGIAYFSAVALFLHKYGSLPSPGANHLLLEYSSDRQSSGAFVRGM